MEIPVVRGNVAERWKSHEAGAEIFQCVKSEESMAPLRVYPFVAIVETELAAEPKEQVDAKTNHDNADGSETEAVVPAEPCNAGEGDAPGQDEITDYYSVH